MNVAVREYLENKLITARIRQKRIEANPNYDDLELGPECSKAFGFPDNSMIVDPDSAILNLNEKRSRKEGRISSQPSSNNLDEMSSKSPAVSLTG